MGAARQGRAMSAMPAPLPTDVAGWRIRLFKGIAGFQLFNAGNLLAPGNYLLASIVRPRSLTVSEQRTGSG